MPPMIRRKPGASLPSIAAAARGAFEAGRNILNRGRGVRKYQPKTSQRLGDFELGKKYKKLRENKTAKEFFAEFNTELSEHLPNWFVSRLTPRTRMEIKIMLFDLGYRSNGQVKYALKSMAKTLPNKPERRFSADNHMIDHIQMMKEELDQKSPSRN